MSQVEYTNVDYSSAKEVENRKTIMVNGVDVNKLTFFGRRKLKKNLKKKERKEEERSKYESLKDGSDSSTDRTYMSRVTHLDDQVNFIDQRIEKALTMTKKSSRPIKLKYKAYNVIMDVATFVKNKFSSLVNKSKKDDSKSKENIDVYAFGRDNNKNIEGEINNGFDDIQNEEDEENVNVVEEPENNIEVDNDSDDNFTNIEVDEVEVPEFDVDLDTDVANENDDEEKMNNDYEEVPEEVSEDVSIQDIKDEDINEYNFDDRTEIQIPAERENQEFVAPMNITKDDLTKVFDDYMEEAKASDYVNHGSNFVYESGDLEYDEDNQQAIKDAYDDYKNKQDIIEEEVNRRYSEQIPEGIVLNEEQEIQIKDALRKQIKAEEEAQQVKEELEKAEREAEEAKRSVEEAKNKYAENVLKSIEMGISKIGEEKEKYTMSIDETHNKTQAFVQEKELFMNKQNEIDSKMEETESEAELNSMLDEADNMNVEEDTIVK